MNAYEKIAVETLSHIAQSECEHSEIRLEAAKELVRWEWDEDGVPPAEYEPKKTFSEGLLLGAMVGLWVFPLAGLLFDIGKILLG